MMRRSQCSLLRRPVRGVLHALDSGLTHPAYSCSMCFSLFAWALIANVAVALVPHEPVVAWYGSRLGVLRTACWATAGTLAASWLDYRLFRRLIRRIAGHQVGGRGMLAATRAHFARAPFAFIALAGITPIPFLPVKALAFAADYPLIRYLAAVAAGRFPRYVLLAWVGVSIVVPAWVGFLLCAFLAAITLGDSQCRLLKEK